MFAKVIADSSVALGQEVQVKGTDLRCHVVRLAFTPEGWQATVVTASGTTFLALDTVLEPV